MITRDKTTMKHEEELSQAAALGFKSWLTTHELKAHIEAERLRVATMPEVYIVAFNKNAGYIKLDVSVVKLVTEIDETGNLVDIEFHAVHDAFHDPVAFKASVFQPGVHPTIQFCRIFKTAKERDTYYDDIAFMAELANDYKIANLNALRRGLGR